MGLNSHDRRGEPAPRYIFECKGLLTRSLVNAPLMRGTIVIVRDALHQLADGYGGEEAERYPGEKDVEHLPPPIVSRARHGTTAIVRRRHAQLGPCEQDTALAEDEGGAHATNSNGSRCHVLRRSKCCTTISPTPYSRASAAISPYRPLYRARISRTCGHVNLVRWWRSPEQSVPWRILSAWFSAIVAHRTLSARLFNLFPSIWAA